MKDTIRIPLENKPLMIAHRGMSGLEMENSASAFVAAGQRSYFGIETDVHRTADGQFIIIHDDDTQRVSGDRMAVEETSFDTLRALQLQDRDGQRGRKDLMLPTLREYIQICKKYEKTAVLELKNHLEEEDIRRIIAIIREEEYLPRVIFISFDLLNMITLRSLLPDQPLQFLTGWYAPFLPDTLTRYRLGLDIRYTALTAEIVADLHSKGIEVNCWTVNTAEEAERLAGFGVDYITTNILEND